MIDLLVLILAVAPVAWLLRYIYRKDKYEKEPLRMLIKAFLLGILAIPLDFVLIAIINSLWVGEMVFYSAFWEAGIPEELSKWLLFMIFIWRNENFNEFFDGIVYASFISLGFACVENIMYVFDNETYFGAIGVGVMRALLSVPGHFLFAVLMGYYLGLAKFKPENRRKYLILSLAAPMLAHGLFDYILMLSEGLEEYAPILGSLLFVAFIYFDLRLWKMGMNRINDLQDQSKRQHDEETIADIKKLEDIFKPDNK